MSRLYHVLDRSFAQVLARATRDSVPHRTAAMAIGVEKVRNAKRVRGLFP
jgi:glutamate dehydrogenase (NAD(P)+)